MNDTDNTNRRGVNQIEKAVLEMELIFREQATSDYGIDAQIEIKESGQPTGRLIAVQIKSGQSYLNNKTDEGFLLQVNQKHRDLWTNHSLPVIIVLCDLSSPLCYWELVTETTCVSTGKHYNLLVPKSKTLDITQISELTDLASPIAAASDYTINKESDYSFAAARRISLDIIAHATNKGLNKPMLGAIARHALSEGKKSNYARNERSASAYAGRPADVVWGHIYLREIDQPAAAWVCHFQWVSPSLDASFRPSPIAGEMAGEDLVIEWKLNNEVAKLLDERRESKTDFLTKTDRLLSRFPAIYEALVSINQSGNLNRKTKNFPNEASAFEESWDNFHSQPEECQRLSETLEELIVTVANAGLVWGETHGRTHSQTLHLSKSYQKDLERLISKLDHLREEVR